MEKNRDVSHFVFTFTQVGECVEQALRGDRQTETDTDTLTNRQTDDRHTDKQTDRQTNRTDMKYNDHYMCAEAVMFYSVYYIYTLSAYILLV